MLVMTWQQAFTQQPTFPLADQGPLLSQLLLAGEENILHNDAAYHAPNDGLDPHRAGKWPPINKYRSTGIGTQHCQGAMLQETGHPIFDVDDEEVRDYFKNAPKGYEEKIKQLKAEVWRGRPTYTYGMASNKQWCLRLRLTANTWTCDASAEESRGGEVHFAGQDVPGAAPQACAHRLLPAAGASERKACAQGSRPTAGGVA